MNRKELFQNSFGYDFFNSANATASKVMLEVCEKIKSEELDIAEEKAEMALRLVGITNKKEVTQIMSYILKHATDAHKHLLAAKASYEINKEFYEKNPELLERVRRRKYFVG